MIDFFYQVMVIILLSIVVGLLMLFIGGLGLQHESLFKNIVNVSNTTEQLNIQDRAHSDNLTRIIINNVTTESTNLTKAILKNLTTMDNQQFEQLDSKLDRLEGIGARIHNDVQQLLERSNNETNSTSRILDILPSFR